MSPNAMKKERPRRRPVPMFFLVALMLGCLLIGRTLRLMPSSDGDLISCPIVESTTTTTTMDYGVLPGVDLETTEQKSSSSSEEEEEGEGPMIIDLVVSVCEEKLKLWLRRLTKNIPIRNVYVYGKCNQTLSVKKKYLNGIDLGFIQGKIEAIQLENVGREGHSFLTHLLRNDINFSEAHWNLFLQGGMEAREKFILDGLDHNETKFKSYQNSSLDYDFVDFGQYGYYRHEDARCLRYDGHKCNRMWRLGYTTFDDLCRLHDEWRSSNRTCEQPMIALRGEFLVRGAVLQRARELYSLKLLKMYGLIAKENNPAWGHWLERLWPEILGAKSLDVIGPKKRRSRTKRSSVLAS